MTPTLKQLYDSRVLWAGQKDGGIELQEACDGYFSVELSAREVRQLARELLQMAEPAAPWWRKLLWRAVL